MRLSDCSCPICLNIIVEPVTLPCDHELCMPCFKQHVAETSLFCPLCRTRLSVWARRAARQKKLVNEQRWVEIKEAFPEQVQNRLEGRDDDNAFEEEVYFQNLAEPGEVRKEYEEQSKKLRDERAESAREEEAASLRLIAELEAEESLRRDQEKRDLELAAAISKELNGVTPQVYKDETPNPAALTVPRPATSLPGTPRAPPKCSTSSTASSTVTNRSATQSNAASPRAGPSKTTTRNGSQGHLGMWYKPKPKSGSTSPVVKASLLSPKAVEERIRVVRNGFEPSSVHITEKKRRLDSDAGPSTSHATKTDASLSRKRLCLTDVGNKGKT